MTLIRALAFRLALILSSILVAIGGTEVALRVWYRDAGARTFGGPGGRSFNHDTIDGELRGRRDVGFRQPGVPRIMVIGDSITYGLGVRDWRNTWPERLAVALEQSGHPYEFAVFALPGDDMPQHLQKMRYWGARVTPDVLIYQWYVNDVEAISHRLDATRSWQRMSWHQSLRTWSYLYYVLDYRLSSALPPREHSYVDYLLTDFAPGTLEWATFEREFHEFASRAKALTSRRILVLYPQVPFRGEYPLRPMHDRMRELAGAHALSVPPAVWMRSAATLANDDSAPWKQALMVPAGLAGVVMDTADYVFGPGQLTVSVVVQRGVEAQPTDTVATLQLIDAESQGVMAETTVQIPGPPTVFSSISRSFTIAGDGLRRVRFRVRSSGQAAWGIADLRVPVNYGFEVVDLAEPLNTFDTHVSMFDAHPNEAAQRVIADELFATMVGHSGR